MNFVSPDPTAPFEPNRSPELLVEQLLLEQSQLTAAQKFSQRHDRDELPSRAKYYRDLIPLSQPAAGEQYAFRVDLDTCSGCKACVVACHELNGLEDDETWREVGQVVGMDADLPVVQHITSACHHCLDPGCVAGCPVSAYEKMPGTGIVRHLDDQCIGCQYCVWMCPYEVPQFSASKGIVRKCDMCQQRLAVDEAPACVQSCPNQAIAIEIVRSDAVRSRAQRGDFLPTAASMQVPISHSNLAPDPRITTPTTRYVTRRAGLTLVEPIYHSADQPQHAHWPLIFMLVLTQFAVGAMLMERFMTLSFAILGGAQDWPSIRMGMSVSALAIMLGGLAIANLHLGRPKLAFRALLGWRTSWLSREVLAFGILAFLHATYVWMQWFAATWEVSPWAVESMGMLAACAALGAVTTSAMVYVATKREIWSARAVFKSFGLATVLLGLTFGLVIVQWARMDRPEWYSTPAVTQIEWCLLIAIPFLTCARLFDYHAKSRNLKNKNGPRASVEYRANQLLGGPLKHQHRLRAAMAILSGIVFPFLIMTGVRELVLAEAGALPGAQWLMLTVVLGARIGLEILERYVFFVTAVTYRMPRGVH